MSNRLSTYVLIFLTQFFDKILNKKTQNIGEYHG